MGPDGGTDKDPTDDGEWYMGRWAQSFAFVESKTLKVREQYQRI